MDVTNKTCPSTRDIRERDLQHRISVILPPALSLVRLEVASFSG